MQKIAARMRAQNQMRAATEPYVAYGSTQELFKICSQFGSYTMPTLKDGESKAVTATGEELGTPSPGSWYEVLDIKPTFNSWAQVAFIHMWLLTVRLRMFPAEHSKHWHQNLLDHFSFAAEDRMATLHGIEVRSARNKYLKDLFVQWRGVLAAYDEGFIKGDAVMGAAVWRDIFGGREDVDAVQIAMVVGWMRRSLMQLDKMTNTDIAGGTLKFPDLRGEKDGVLSQSKGVTEPLSETA